MSAVQTLESVAALLRAEQRERFLKMVSRFRSVPEDDEYLQVLEAIGFMTLLWREVPQDIQRILERADPEAATGHSVAGIVRDAVAQSIPSYEDLKAITQHLEAHELALKNTLSAIPQSRQSGGSWFWVLTVFAAGLTAGFMAHDFLLSLLP